MGYSRAGFTEIVGVDNRPQPRYPFTFVQADALEYVAEHGWEFDAIHASPPCQAYSITRNIHPELAQADLYHATRRLLVESCKPWVIENTPGVPMPYAIVLCGSAFKELNVYRHRLFESALMLFGQSCRGHLDKCTQVGRKPKPGERLTVAGHWSGIKEGKAAMGIDWMNRAELSQAIPPAYTEFIGKQLIAQLNRAKDQH